LYQQKVVNAIFLYTYFSNINYVHNSGDVSTEPKIMATTSIM